MRYYIFLLFLIAAVALRFIFSTQEPLTEGEISFTSSLLDTPEQMNVQRFTLPHPSGQGIFIATTRYPEYSYGERLDVSGRLRIVQTDDGRELAVMSFPKITEAKEQDSLLQAAGFIRERVGSVYEASLPPESASLLLGIVLGSKEGMSEEFEDDLSKTGLMHVVAASGMNVTLLAGFVFSTLGRLFRRQIALSFSIAAIVLYAVLAGLDPSIVRASIMASLAFTAALFGRQAQALFSLIATALLMLLISPQLFWDIGFQLSFVATAGIITLKPKLPFGGQKDELDKLGVVKEDVTTSLATQIATLPLLFFYFHSYGILSLFVNLLLLWTVAPLMILGGIAGIISLVLPPLASLIALLALPLTMFFVFVVQVFADLTPVITLVTITWPMIVGYYLAVIAVFNFRYAKTTTH